MSFDLLAVGGTGVAFALEYLLARRQMSAARQDELARILLLDPDESDPLRELMIAEAKAQDVTFVEVEIGSQGLSATGSRTGALPSAASSTGGTDAAPTLRQVLLANDDLSPLMRVLLNHEDLSIKFALGFMGRPKVASTILSRVLPGQKTCIDQIIEKIQTQVPPGVTSRVIAGSIAGGTGAGLIPLLCRRLRGENRDEKQNRGIFELHVLAFLPWFEPDRRTDLPSPELQQSNAHGGLLALRDFVESCKDSKTPTWVYVLGPDAKAVGWLRRPTAADVQQRGTVSPLFRDLAYQLNQLTRPVAAGSNNASQWKMCGMAVVPPVTQYSQAGAPPYYRGLGLAVGQLAEWSVHELVRGGVPRLEGLPAIIKEPMRAAVASGNADLLSVLTARWKELADGYLNIPRSLTGADRAVEAERAASVDEVQYSTPVPIAEQLDAPVDGDAAAQATLIQSLCERARVKRVKGEQDLAQLRYKIVAEVIASVLERRLFGAATSSKNAPSIASSITVPLELKKTEHYDYEDHGKTQRFILTKEGADQLLTRYSIGALSFNSSSIASPLGVIHASMDAVKRNDANVVAWCRAFWFAAVRGWLTFTPTTQADDTILAADEAWVSDGIKVVSIGSLEQGGVPIGVTSTVLGFVPAAGMLDDSPQSRTELLGALRTWAEGMPVRSAMARIVDAVKPLSTSLRNLQVAMGSDVEPMRSKTEAALGGFWSDGREEPQTTALTRDDVALWRSRILVEGQGNSVKNGQPMRLAFAKERDAKTTRLPRVNVDEKAGARPTITTYQKAKWTRPQHMPMSHSDITLKLDMGSIPAHVPTGEVHAAIAFDQYGQHPFPLVPGVCFERLGAARELTLVVWKGRQENHAVWNAATRTLTLEGVIDEHAVTVRVVIGAALVVTEVSRAEVFLDKPGCIALYNEKSEFASRVRWVDVPVKSKYLALVEAAEGPEEQHHDPAQRPQERKWTVTFKGGVVEPYAPTPLYGAFNKGRIPIAVWPNPAHVPATWRYFTFLLGQFVGDNSVSGAVLTRNEDGWLERWLPVGEGVTCLNLSTNDPADSKVLAQGKSPWSDVPVMLDLRSETDDLGAFILPKGAAATQGGLAHIGLDFGTSNTSVAVRSKLNKADAVSTPPGGDTPLVLARCSSEAQDSLVWLSRRWLASTRSHLPRDQKSINDHLPTALHAQQIANEAAGPYQSLHQLHPQETAASNAKITTDLKWGLEADVGSQRRTFLEMSMLAALAGPYEKAEFKVSYPLAMPQGVRRRLIKEVADLGKVLGHKVGFEVVTPTVDAPATWANTDETTVMLYGLLNAFSERRKGGYDQGKLYLGIAIDIGGGTVDLLAAPVASEKQGAAGWDRFFVLAADSLRYGANLLAHDLRDRLKFDSDHDLQVALRRGLAEKFHVTDRKMKLDAGAFAANMKEAVGAGELSLPTPQGKWETLGQQFGDQIELYFRDIREYVARFLAGPFLDRETFKYRAAHARGTDLSLKGTPADAAEEDAKDPVEVEVHYLLSGNGWGWLGSLQQAAWVGKLNERVGELLKWNTAGAKTFIKWPPQKSSHEVIGKAAVATFLISPRELATLKAEPVGTECTSDGIHGFVGAKTGVRWFQQTGAGAPARTDVTLPDGFSLHAPPPKEAEEDKELIERLAGEKWSDCLEEVQEQQKKLMTLDNARAPALRLLYERILINKYIRDPEVRKRWLGEGEPAPGTAVKEPA